MNNKEWRKTVRAVTESCKGVFSVEWTAPNAISRLLQAALTDPVKKAHLGISSGLVCEIVEGHDINCLACENPVRELADLGAVMSMFPMAAQPSHGLASAICDKCANRFNTADLWRTLVAEKLRQIYGEVEIRDAVTSP